jgi:hypothetical protein
VLAALECELHVRAEGIGVEADELLELADRLESAGRWRDAATTLRMAANMSSDDDAFSSAAARVDVLADARGLTESRAWILQARAERALLRGDWDAAHAYGSEAADVGVVHGYTRAVVRTWFVVSPIAAARGDVATLERISAWFEERAGTFPDTPYGQIMHRAIDVDLASLAVAPPPALNPEQLLPGCELPYDNADWLLAIERVMRAWISSGRTEAARDGLAAQDSRPDDPGSLGAVSRSLLASWLTEAEGNATEASEHAHSVLSAPAAGAAPWWELRALRVLERLGTSTTEHQARARVLEGRLGVPPVPDTATAR